MDRDEKILVINIIGQWMHMEEQSTDPYTDLMKDSMYKSAYELRKKLQKEITT